MITPTVNPSPVEQLLPPAVSPMMTFPGEPAMTQTFVVPDAARFVRWLKVSVIVSFALIELFVPTLAIAMPLVTSPS